MESLNSSFYPTTINYKPYTFEPLQTINVIPPSGTIVYPCITEHGTLFAAKKRDGVTLMDHVEGPYYCKEYKCRAYLIADPYTKRQFFSTSKGDYPGFYCPTVYVE
jgi:hypothetical protein